MEKDTGTQVQSEFSGLVHTGHPTPLTYFKIAMTLVVLTAIEVAIFYVEDLGKWIIPILAVLSIGKFALVAMFYMHLKYDSKLFTSFFGTGVVLIALVITALLVLFRFFF